MSNDVADFSLTDLRTVISEKYKPAVIEIGEGRTVRLEQIARLSDDRQEELILMQNDFKELRADGAKLQGNTADVTPEALAEWREGLDHEPTPDEVDEFKKQVAQAAVGHDEVKAFKKRTTAVLEKMLRLVAVTEDDGEQLIAACNGDELLLMEVFTRYSKRTKLGEASASPSSSESTAGPSSTTSVSS